MAAERNYAHLRGRAMEVADRAKGPGENPPKLTAPIGSAIGGAIGGTIGDTISHGTTTRATVSLPPLSGRFLQQPERFSRGRGEGGGGSFFCPTFSTGCHLSFFWCEGCWRACAVHTNLS